MPVQLVPMNGGAFPAVTISRPVMLIGRHNECDVQLDSPLVSRRHCCVALAYDRMVIRDLGSANGVRVNGRRVEESSLVHGDEVAIAHFLYRLVEEPLASARPSPVPGASNQAKPASPFGSPSDDLIPIDD